MNKDKKNLYVASNKGLQKVYYKDTLSRAESEYIIDLKFFYSMTDEEAENYYKQLKFNEEPLIQIKNNK